jgi:predicted dehydrogenase
LEIAMPERIRTGVIGAGWWSTDHHIPGLLAHPDAELVAVCDPHAGRLAEAARAYNLTRTYPDYTTMLANEALDAVFIVTPHATHYAIAKDCLERNLHLFIEKPMTLHAREAGELVRMAQERKREIAMGYAYLYSQHAERAREIIASGGLGQIQYVECTFSSDMTHFLGGKVSPDHPPYRHFAVNPPGEAYNRPDLLGGGHGHLQITHVLGWMFGVTGLRARRVQAAMNNLGRAVDMVGVFLVEFEGGALGTVGGTGNATAAHRTSLAVYGEEGAYVADSLAGFAGLYHKDGAREELSWSPVMSTRYNTTTNFIDTLLGRAANRAPGEIGWRAVELLEAAYRSSQRGGEPVLIDDLYS